MPGESCRALLNCGGRVIEAMIGRSGFTVLKREGDGATPVACMPLLYGYYRPDRVPKPRTRLAMKPIRADLGWCDESGHPAYNRSVRLPFSRGHERMMRDDGLYDVCLVMDWNVRSRMRGRGSAIFFHLMAKPPRPTEGCIAIGYRDMVWLLERIGPGTRVVVAT
jgi:L,D-peptidoglycan transpeptidase YkuD (ErfK/YbiS/YcfS/YnhG family)